MPFLKIFYKNPEPKTSIFRRFGRRIFLKIFIEAHIIENVDFVKNLVEGPKIENLDFLRFIENVDFVKDF